MEVKKLVPKRRFAGFEREWEQNTFGSLYDVISGHAFRTEEYVNKGIPIINGESIQNGKLKTLNLNYLPKGYLTKYENIQLKTNDIVLGLNRPIINNQLKITLIPSYLNNSLLYQRAGKIVNLANVHNYFSYKLLEKEILKFVRDEAVGSDQPFISTTLLKKTLITLPKKECEQQKIGSFFKVLDERIANQERKIAKVKAVKEAYLTEMFPQEGESIPKRRFSGFEGEWNLVQLGEVCEGFEYGLNVEAKVYDGKNKYLRITDIDDYTREFNKKGITSPNINLEKAKNYILTEGDILFARTGASVGKTYRYQKKDGIVYYAGFLIKAKVKAQYDSEFIFTQTLSTKYYNFVKVTSQRSGQPGINAQEYSTFSLLVPTLKEQQKIGQFFKNLDAQIQTEEEKLEKLKKMKEAYLEEMFV